MKSIADLLKPKNPKPISPTLAAWEKWKNTADNDLDANDAFLGEINPIISQAVNLYGSGGTPATIRAHAKRLALEAAGKFDPTRGDFKTHMLTQLQPLRRVVANQMNLMQVPEKVRFDSNTLRRIETELADDLGRDPTDSELAEHTGMSPKRIAYVRGFRPGFTTSQVERMTRGDDGVEGLDPGVVRKDPFEARLEMVYDTLSPTDQLIIDHTLGRNGRPQLGTNAISSKVGVTAGAISQRLRKIQDEMDTIERLGVF